MLEIQNQQHQKIQISLSDSIEKIGKEQWNQMAEGSGPFVRYEFLRALETSYSVGQGTGWTPKYASIFDNQTLIAVLPCYEKSHSYGEYVFDHSWAHAYQRYGKPYYPKIVCAIPFTPVTGARLLHGTRLAEKEVQTIYRSLKQWFSYEGSYSFHWLFVDKKQSTLLDEVGFSQRVSVQFQWFNKGYQEFSDYLASFSSRKRKNVRKEREKVARSEVSIKRLTGDNIQQQDMEFFYQCYQQTYLKRSGHQGYLTREFFIQLYHSMANNILIVIASIHQENVAAALYLFDQDQLAGRYWGALEEIDGLHFECCYYQGIEFCIENGIAMFNPGTQGEHKILRGFEPIYCYSNHFLKDQMFMDAVNNFLDEERPHIETYKKQAATLLPYKKQL